MPMVARFHPAGALGRRLRNGSEMQWTGIPTQHFLRRPIGDVVLPGPPAWAPSESSRQRVAESSTCAAPQNRDQFFHLRLLGRDLRPVPSDDAVDALTSWRNANADLVLPVVTTDGTFWDSACTICFKAAQRNTNDDFLIAERQGLKLNRGRAASMISSSESRNRQLRKTWGANRGSEQLLEWSGTRQGSGWLRTNNVGRA
jgi:hypothetical protein